MILLLLSSMENDEDRNKVIFVYKNFRLGMFWTAREILKSNSLAEDAVNDSFVQIIRNIDNIDLSNIPKTRGYVNVICRNMAYKILRKNPDVMEEYDEDKISDIVCDPLDNIIARESIDSLADAINRIPQKYADILLMKVVSKMSINDISKTCGISCEAVKKRLQNAKKLIILEIKKEGYSYEDYRQCI